MISDEIRNWATAYAAIVATLSLLWNIVIYLRNQPSVIVEGQYSFENGEHAIRFDLTNKSAQSKVTIVALGFKIKSSKGMITLLRDAYVDSKILPKTLGESETFPVFTRLSAFKRVGDIGYVFDEIEYLVARDSTGKLYKSLKTPLKADGYPRLN